MYLTKSCEDGYFKQGQLNPYGNIQLSPSAGVLNYGQVFATNLSLTKILDFPLFTTSNIGFCHPESMRSLCNKI